jgi:uncharacterized protein (TIGR02246 family)
LFLLACLTQSATVDHWTTNNVQDEPEKAILAAAESYVSAFNSRDAEKLAQLWAEKATYTLPDTGEKLVGRDAIREMFAKTFADPDAGELSVTVETIRFVTPEVVRESGNKRAKAGLLNPRASMPKVSSLNRSRFTCPKTLMRTLGSLLAVK